MDLTIEPFIWHKHSQDVLQLSFDTWFFDIPQPNIAYHANLHFLLHYLLPATHIAVAKYQQKAVGLMALKEPNVAQTPYHIQGSTRTYLQLRKLLSSMYMNLNPKAQVARHFDELFFVNYQKLRKLVPAHLKQSPEMTLLITAPSMVGKGVGKALVSYVCNFLCQKGYQNYFLLTDSSCTYQFYDRLGMTRHCDVSMCFKLNHIPSYNHYLNGFLRGYIYSYETKLEQDN